MGTPAENLIATFEQLPDAEKQKVASAILRHTLKIEFPPVSAEERVLSAEETFLELDRREAADAQTLTVVKLAGPSKTNSAFSGGKLYRL